jgi:hypothetical protein
MSIKFSRSATAEVLSENTATNSCHPLGNLYWLSLVCICAFPKLLMIGLSDAHVGGDSFVYLKVAENIFANSCVSLSDPASEFCAPHWGGNQLPGYPAFIAATWMMFGKSVFAVLFSQVAFFALVSGYLCKVLARTDNGIFQNTKVILAVALLLGASPSLIGWSRAILTETLSIALALWLLAELVASLQDRRLRIFRIGIVLTLGVFVRYDFAMFVVPVAAVGFYLHAPMVAIRKGSCIALIVLVPLGGWTARCVYQGLDYTPPYGLTPEGQNLPAGMLRWVGTWLDNQYELEKSVWALVHFDYESFSAPKNAYASSEEAARVGSLIRHLRTKYQGKPAPSLIDREFMDIAEDRISNNRLEQWIGLPLRRMAHMWLSPFPSMGWPAEISDSVRPRLKSALAARDWSVIARSILEVPGTVAMKTLVTGHRYLVVFLVIFGLLYWRQYAPPVRFIILVIIGLVVFRSVLFSFTLLTETRYLAPALAWLDVAAVIFLATIHAARKNRLQK